MKNPISRESIKNASIKTVSAVCGSIYTIAQGAADMAVAIEAAAVHKLDNNYTPREVAIARRRAYKLKVTTAQLQVTIAKEKYIKAKHYVERKVEDLRYGKLEDEVLNHMSQDESAEPAL